MAVETPPGVLNSVSTPAAAQRHTTQALLGVPIASFAGGVGATAGGGHGVCGPTDLAVSQTGGGAMSVDVAKGMAFIVGTVSAAQGAYSFYNDAPVTLSIAAAHATLARRDLIVAQIQDADWSGAVRSARLLVVTGTPSGAPVDPSLAGTPNALVLARVTVPAAASSILNANITGLRTFARALGVGAWAPYSPVLAGTGWAIGNGTIVGRACITQERVDFSILVTLGSTSTAGAGFPTLTLPATSHAEWPEMLLRSSTSCSLSDATGGTYHGPAAFVGVGTITPLVANAAGTYAADNNVSGTIPFTWAVNDQIGVSGWYRPA